jgi:hypothetical protein
MAETHNEKIIPTGGIDLTAGPVTLPNTVVNVSSAPPGGVPVANGPGSYQFAERLFSPLSYGPTQNGARQSTYTLIGGGTGSIGDGSGRALSTVYSTLAAAQVDYPFVAALTSTVDYAALQLAINEAISTEGTLTIPPYYRFMLNTTVEFKPSSGTSFKLNVRSNNALQGMVRWTGESKAIIFKSYGWNYGFVESMSVQLPASQTEIVAWDFDVNASYPSAGNVRWYNCWVGNVAGESTKYTAWRLGYSSNGYNISDVDFYDCTVGFSTMLRGTNTYAAQQAHENGHVGWRLNGSNTLDCRWFASGGGGCNYVWTTAKDTGAISAGNNSYWFFGCSGSNNYQVYQHESNAGTVGFFGGRWELGYTFLSYDQSFGGGDTGATFILDNLEVQNYASETQFALAGLTNLVLRGVTFSNLGPSPFAFNFGPEFITYKIINEHYKGTVVISDSQLTMSSSAPPFTHSGGAGLNVKMTRSVQLSIAKGSIENVGNFPEYDNVQSPGAIEAKVYTSSATWTKPAWATQVQVYGFGSGGGGGSGRQTASGTAASGGAGGGGGGFSNITLPAGELPETVAVTVASGGTGGAAQATASTNGNSGSAGSGTTAFGSYLRASNGAGGPGGSTATVSGGSGGNGTASGASGAGCVLGSAGGVGPQGFAGAPGGGGGGGLASTPAVLSGGQGGGSFQSQGSGGVGGSTEGQAGTEGSNISNLNLPIAGNAGGGGASAANGVTTGGTGGQGGHYGAGGGGGGASLNGAASGAGGNGAGGVVIVISK